MKKKAKNFEFLEHTADVFIAAYGRDLNEAFENAALAMFETMTETERVKPKVEETVVAEGNDKQSLFYTWLEELLIRFEVNDMLYSRFKIEKIEDTEEGFRLNAKIYGEMFKPKRHKQKVGIKSVTYHRMEIREDPGEVTIKFILDI